MTSTKSHALPLEQSGYPLAFVSATGSGGPGTSFRCEVMGLGRFQKEGLVTDLATGRIWRLAADEGKYLRGTDMAPAPLMHWAAGVHGDLTARIGQLLMAAGISFTELDVRLTQGFGSRGSFARGEAVGLVFDLKWRISLQTDAPAAAVKPPVDEAFRSSPVLRVLTGAVEGGFALWANGRPVDAAGVPRSQEPPATDPYRQYATRPAPVDDATPAEDLLRRRTAPGTAQVELTDDLDGSIAWFVQATGTYRAGAGLVDTTIAFPGSGASQWSIVSDPQGERAPSPLAYFSIGTAFCYHTQLCRYVDIRRLPVSRPRLVQANTFEPADMRLFDTQLFLNGSVDEPQAKSLLLAAANACYAHRALSIPINSAHRLEILPA